MESSSIWSKERQQPQLHHSQQPLQEQLVLVHPLLQVQLELVLREHQVLLEPSQALVELVELGLELIHLLVSVEWAVWVAWGV